MGLYRVEGTIALVIDQISFCTFHLLVHHPDVCALNHRATDSVNPPLPHSSNYVIHNAEIMKLLMAASIHLSCPSISDSDLALFPGLHLFRLHESRHRAWYLKPRVQAEK